ncbi:hypothetical protein ZIOFF_035458 [Zingiber officinale]|uniref:dUTP diphosphatase n=1 Tax=Zingiber officinale TaxID=94328 RepID=A0A8J5GMN3_ZINOF|nr:hypothetical protein ZIOFF_035458 [Zingiber officinale]
MDIPGYAPAGSSRGWAGIEEANLAGKKPKKWENNSEWFQLPSANARRGSVFVMPYDFDPKEGIEVVSVGMNESDLSDIYSVSEGEDLPYQPEEFDIFMLQQTDISQETLKIRRTHPLAFLPQRKTEGAAGYDLSTCEGCVLTPHSHAILNTGISIKLPEGTYGRIAPRSGLSAKGIFINGGVIDADFRGSIQVILFNFSFENILFNIGDNIAQLIIEKIALPEVEEVQFLDQTQRGSRGFRSTDKQEERKVSAAFKPVPIPINMLQVIEDEPSEYLIGESEWRSQMRVSRKEYLCQHDWSYDETTAADCRDCKLEARAGNRIDCRKCKLIICSLCTYHCFKISWPSTTRTQMKKTDWKSLSALQSNLIQKFIRRENELEEEVKNLRQQISGMEELAIIQEAPSEYERELAEVQQENIFLKLMNEKQQKEIEALKQEKQLLLELEEINKRELMDLKTRLLVPSPLPVLTFNEYYVNAAPQRNNLLNIKHTLLRPLTKAISEVLQKPNPVAEARMASYISNALRSSKKGNELVNVIINNQLSLQCACGRDAALLVSHTSRNPGRHFYKCSTDTCHSWYWADLIENYVQQRLNMEAPLAQKPINWVNIEQHGYWDNDPVWEEPGLGEPEVINNDDEANSEVDDPTEDSSLFHQHMD